VDEPLDESDRRAAEVTVDRLNDGNDNACGNS